MNQLPNSDTARIASLNDDKLMLKQIDTFLRTIPQSSYEAIRSFEPDLLNVQSEMFGSIGRPSWESLRRQVELASVKRASKISCAELGQKIYEYADKESLFGRPKKFFSRNLGVARGVRFWTDAAFSLRGERALIYLEPRVEPLSFAAKKFIFSIMHEHIREADPTFANYELLILEFPRTGGVRKPKETFAREMSFHSTADIVAMINRAYALFNLRASEVSWRKKRTA